MPLLQSSRTACVADDLLSERQSRGTGKSMGLSTVADTGVVGGGSLGRNRT